MSVSTSKTHSLNTRIRTARQTRRGAGRHPLTPVAQAVALLLMAGGVVDAAQAGPAAFSSGWFGAMGATHSQMRSSGMTPGGALAGIPTTAQQQQQSQQQLQQSLNNLNRAAAAIAAQQAAQQAARLNALNDPSVPDGLADGGLKVDTNALTKGWKNANAPTQSTAGGRTTVSIQQTADKAILNWETFNVGKNTTVQFEQQADWAVLNRVNDPNTRPSQAQSQIQGQVKGAGTVMIMNRNGIVFSGSSQVNVRNLVAAAANVSDAQFTNNGIYSLQANGTYTPSFTDALGAVEVQPGASLTTAAPTSVTQGGGYVLLAGAQVSNAGSITTPQGQALLAAGDSFIIRRGVATDANMSSTTRGNEVIGTQASDSLAGAASNTGLIQSPEGDITLTGRQVLQDGVALSTTTVNNRGTIHLSNSASDAQGTVTLGGDAVTAIVLDDSGGTALDSQRSALILASAQQDLLRRSAAPDVFDNLSKLDDRRDQSRIEIVSGSTTQFADGSITLATGGQVAVSSVGRSLVGNGALVDVSGAVGVQVAMASNNVQINVQGNEQRDAPGARDAQNLNNSDVWVDRRSLVHVAAGVGGDANERWYTDGGLLEVGGYLDLAGHSIGEWAAQGGTVTFAGGEVVTQKGSSINLSGGTYDVQSGYIRMSWIRGTDGRLYDVSNAPGDQTYQGLYVGYEDAHTRWGDTATRYFYNPLIAPRQRYEDGYTVGRDAGRLVVSTSSAVLEGDAVTATYQGPRQTEKASTDWDGYTQSQDAAARGAQLILGTYQTAVTTDTANNPLAVAFNLTPAQQNIVFGEPDAIADKLQLPAAGANNGGNSGNGNPVPPLPDDSQGTAFLDSALIDRWNLGGIIAAANESVTVDNALQVAPGGTIQLYAPHILVDADMTAHSGSIVLSDVLNQTAATGKPAPVQLPAVAGVPVEIAVGQGITLDATGLWTNLLDNPADRSLLPYQDGGDVTIRTSGAVSLAQGSVVDVSSGAALLPDGTLQGGRGGNVTLAAGYRVTGSTALPANTALQLLGELRAYGVSGSGMLDIESGTAVGIGGKLLDTDGLLPAGQAAPTNLVLLQDYQLAAGDIAPMDLVVTISRRPGGYTADAPLQLLVNQSTPPLVVHADWQLPADWLATVQDSQGHFYTANDVVPKDTVIVNVVAIPMPTGSTIPADAFPDGVPIVPQPVLYRAGSVLDAPYTLTAGSMLAAGAKLARPVAVAATGSLDTQIFHTGFSSYAVIANGIAVMPGTELDVTMPVLRVDPTAMQSLATGGSLADRVPVWTPPLYQEDPVHAALVQRGGASLELQANSSGSAAAAVGAPPASLNVGAGARIAVDPGQSISLTGQDGQVTIDGRLDAWGGSISIASLPGTGSQASPTRSIWIGDDAVLDAGARAYVAHDNQGRAYGIAPDGGGIEIGPSDSFIVIRPGAVLDASGASAQVDASAGGQPGAPSQPLQLAGAGGSIGLHSYVGMVIDGTLSAHAGGAGVAGGSLTLEMLERAYATTEVILPEYQVLHNLTLTRQHSPSGLAAGLAPGQADPALQYGQAVLGVDQVQAGGFDALTLAAHDLIVFDGDVNLSLGRSLNLRNGNLTVADATPDAQVRLAAPYIRLDGGSWVSTADRYTPGILQVSPGKTVRNDSSLTLAADLVDVYGVVASGYSGLAGNGAITPPGGNYPGIDGSRPFDTSGFNLVTLDSTGDVRLNNAALIVSGDLTVAAAQIYPASGERGQLIAGLVSEGTENNPVTFDAARSLVIRSNGPAPALPDSVFGELMFLAPTLDQGGVVRAPLGTIALNDLGGNLNRANLPYFPGSGVNGDMRLVLRDGSLTSVSAAGLVMPFGGTADGLTYRGADGTLFSLAGNSVTRAPNGDTNVADNDVLPQGISLGGGSIVAEAGSVLDLSGGGDLRGAGFISGRGGSVDVLTTPLANANPAANRYSSAGNAVYAILPGYASDYAPLVADKGAGDPAIGRQVTIGAGVPGLPAGTYTLLPASFALMPGAFRVEIGPRSSALAAGMPSGTAAFGAAAGRGTADGRQAPQAVSLPNGSWSTLGTLGTTGTGQHDVLPSQVLVTPGQVVRQYSQYNETSYADFAVAQAAQFGNVRPMLPADGKILRFNLLQNDDAMPLQFDGMANLDAARGGVRGQVAVLGNAPIDVVGAPAQPTPGTISVSADTLSAFNASTLSIGGNYQYIDEKTSVVADGARVYFNFGGLSPQHVSVGDGATLRAGQIFLIGDQITVDGGAMLDTRGMGSPGVDSNSGFVYANNPSNANPSSAASVLAVSNGWLDFLPSVGPGRIVVHDGASLLTEGTVAFAAPGGLDLGDLDLGARYLTVSQDQVNIGTSAGLAAAQAAGTMQAGWQLTQETLDRLLRPSSTDGVPELERLSLTAGGAFNFYGSVTLDTGDSSAQMVFNTPAFYGLGEAGDVVRIATRELVWNGLTSGDGSAANPFATVAPVPVQPGGPGTGSGRLVIDAQTVLFGYDDLSRPQRQTELGRLALGFSSLEINASDRITANSKGVLTVGRSQDTDGTLHGGNLSLATPLLTGQAGADIRYVAGGAIDVSAPQGAAPAVTDAVDELGASVTLQGASVNLDTAVALPSGVLKIVADGDILLGDGAQIDLSGRAVTFFDITKYSWGGSVDAESANGNIAQAAGSRIDVSAANNDAGALTVAAGQGTVTLAGMMAGKGGPGFDDGSFGMTTGSIDSGSFAALNQRLNDAGFLAARSFDIKQGDLVVGDGARAHSISITTDAGNLTVDGTIDASGDGPGNIVLAAGGNLVLTAHAVLDAHGNTLVLDSYGAPIDASNRAKIMLASTAGTVQLNTGAVMDLSSPDGVARGQVEIDAPRVGGTAASATGAGAPANATGGDIAVSAAGPLDIRGARSIALNGFARYTNAPADPADNNGQLITQAYLDQIDLDSQAFDTAARSNADLQARTAGLSAYGAAFHLRPGVEIDSATPDGNLTVHNDLDLSGYRYGPNANRDVSSALYGAGEPMALVVRAGGDLTINGSINDGFAPPPATPDDAGWLIHQQILLAGVPASSGITFTPLFSPDLGGNGYVFPSFSTGEGYPVVASGSVSDDFGTYNPGDMIPGFLFGTITIAAGTVLTSDVAGGADIVLNGPRPDPGRMWQMSQMLAPGSLSASIRLVSGADLQAADTRALRTMAQLAGRGNMTLDDLHGAAFTTLTPTEAISVVRTGTGDLDLYVGGSYQQNSLFGVYTAGTSVAGTGADSGYNAPRAVQPDGTVLGADNSAYESALASQRMWFTENGGDFTLSAQGNITGYLQPETLSLGDWLWRQGGAELGQRTAWAVNFGSYVVDSGQGSDALGQAGYAGVGALGGGNATIHAGGNIGVAGDPTRGLMAAVGGTGRVTDSGALLQTGGGALAVTAGGKVSGGLYADLRGDTLLKGGDVGSVTLTDYGAPAVGDPLAADPHTAYKATVADAVNFAPGDGALRVDTLGDVAVAAIVDPGRVGERTETQAASAAASGTAASWFTLWTDRTAVDLFSAGGNASPFATPNLSNPSTGLADVSNVTNVVPGKFSAVAAGGSIYYQPASADADRMMPTPDGGLDLLAQGLIAGRLASTAYIALGPLGTTAASMATPQHAAWRIADAGKNLVDSNYWGDAAMPLDSIPVYSYTYTPFFQVNQGLGGNLFMFGPNTTTDDSVAGYGAMSHIYAVNGDVMGVTIGSGDVANGGPLGLAGPVYYQASKPVRMLAGGDIVNSKGLIVQGNASDISMLAAGGDILLTEFSIAGPGTLEVSAGGQIYQGNTTSLTSLGPLAQGDKRPGADIVVQAGLGAGAPGEGATNNEGFARLYLDPANQADPDLPLADQPGKVAKTYDTELAQWLASRFDYSGLGATDALAYFLALPAEQQRVFVRQVYYAELLASGREYNDETSKRFNSYLRGREAIATLFPATGTDGTPIVRSGDLTLLQGGRTDRGVAANAGVRTVAGGTIQVLTPGGQTIVGVEGVLPSPSPANPAGLLTQGSGDIQIYSQGSVLLGLSRIMTTFGGNIQAWSAEGDINAGRGSKTTVVYTPPNREYDDYGNVTMSPNVPSSGAGIATLNPIPEVPAGDVDLIAPLGTIDAGEAGIRVSGDINIAALHVVNAANIQVQGKSTGIPVVAAVNTSALTSASAAASSAANAAQDMTRQQQAAARQALPSIITVQVLGFGNEPVAPVSAPTRTNTDMGTTQPISYRPDSPVQVVGNGALSDAQRARLSPEERRELGL